MSKIIEFIRRTSDFLVILLLFITVGYFAFSLYLKIYFPFPISLEIRRIYVTTLSICFLAVLPALLASTFPIVIRIASLVVAIPFCCLFSYLALNFPERIMASAELGNQNYHITAKSSFDEPRTIYSLYKCNAKDLECDRIYADVGGASVDDVNLIVDEKINEVYALRHGYLIYADGVQSHEILESEQFANHVYYIGVYPSYGSSGISIVEHTYVLFKCESSFTLCQQLPFHYTDTGGSFKFEFDSNTNEIKVYQWKYNTDDILIFSYGVVPKCYVKRCTIPDN